MSLEESNKGDSSLNEDIEDDGIDDYPSDRMEEEIRKPSRFTADEVYRNYQQLLKDLEFIQMLANPSYVLSLVDRGYLANEQFLEYLDNLKVFYQKRELFSMIKYPEGLANLKKIQERGFSISIRNPINRDKFILSCLNKNSHIRAGSYALSLFKFSDPKEPKNTDTLPDEKSK